MWFFWVRFQCILWGLVEGLFAVVGLVDSGVRCESVVQLGLLKLVLMFVGYDKLF